MSIVVYRRVTLMAHVHVRYFIANGSQTVGLRSNTCTHQYYIHTHTCTCTCMHCKLYILVYPAGCDLLCTWSRREGNQLILTSPIQMCCYICMYSVHPSCTLHYMYMHAHSPSKFTHTLISLSLSLSLSRSLPSSTT